MKQVSLWTPRLYISSQNDMKCVVFLPPPSLFSISNQLHVPPSLHHLSSLSSSSSPAGASLAWPLNSSTGCSSHASMLNSFWLLNISASSSSCLLVRNSFTRTKHLCCAKYLFARYGNHMTEMPGNCLNCYINIIERQKDPEPEEKEIRG